ncbi:glycoside hydrolase family 88 protein [Acholeplasma equirhinis]|uniref:glycoside hydrolase family 88/105 protein n=1 Tax=Acholeplasma equirhinis TaxID=555393 RepID=UPI00197A9AC5|nr:glycoside hydrolase family 88 protein [Acholeplasma equirhinis]MBN3490746.1 glycoside hydrolase family 88 protein [Acholeplasma equirhinis]
MYPKVEQYIKYLIENSTPEKPLWNQELLRQGKENRWNYIDGCITASLIALYQATNEKSYLDFVKSFVDYFVNQDGTIKGYNPLHYSTDDLSQSRILFDLYETTHDDKYKKAIHHTYLQVKTHPRIKTGNFWHKKIYHDQVWLDGLYMMQVFYTRYEKTFNDKKNYDDILNQFKNVRKLMFDEKKKLYYHGYDESRTLFWANKKTGLSENFWLRAIGWLAAGLVDVATYIDDLSIKQELSSQLKELLDGILKYQDKETHLFYNLVDLKNVEGNYLETSGSLLIAYSMLKGANEGILPEKYYTYGLQIFDTIYDERFKLIDGLYILSGTVLVSGLGPEDNKRRDGSIEYYLSEPVVDNEAKGIGPFIMAYTEIKRKATK